MGDYNKTPATRPELKKRIVDAAVQAFTTQGIKAVTMDDIAASLGISKRTLYEVFEDKEALLEACIVRGQCELEQFLTEVQATADNVLEVLMKLFKRSIEKYHSTNKRFFEEIKKYPKAYEQIRRGHSRDSDDAAKFFREGVRQGIFRDDVNFAIVNLLVREQFRLLMDTDICRQYPFNEVYESIIFTHLRGISTERGAQELEKFIREYRGGQ